MEKRKMQDNDQEKVCVRVLTNHNYTTNNDVFLEQHTFNNPLLMDMSNCR
jgi:hypothetical protein